MVRRDLRILDSWGRDPFFIGDPVITVDTTEFAEVDEASAIETVRRAAGLS